jgi:ABC-type phosphate transport system substrate-binding protein
MKKIIYISVFITMMIPQVYAQVAIIANKGVSANSLTIGQLKNLYTLQSNELNSQKVKIFFLTSEGTALSTFLKGIGENSGDLKKQWLKAKLTGGSAPPEAVASEDDVLSKVSSTSGAIGFVSVDKISPNVKVLLEIK